MAQSSNKILCDFIKLRILWANSPFNFTIHVFCIQHIWTHLSIFIYDKISAWRQTINKYVEGKWSSLYVSRSILLFSDKQFEPDSLFVLLYHILKYVGVTFTILHFFSIFTAMNIKYTIKHEWHVQPPHAFLQMYDEIRGQLSFNLTSYFVYRK